jgi:hypothetical protein
MFLPGMTSEELKKEMETWAANRQRQEREYNWQTMEYGNLVVMELRKQTLGVTKQQWNLIEPKYKRVEALHHETHFHMPTSVSRNQDKRNFHWKKLTEDDYFWKAKAPSELTEGEKIAEELIDLLEDENSKDEDIRHKMNALKQVREKAQKESQKAEQELVKVLSPRQEAILLLWEFID